MQRDRAARSPAAPATRIPSSTSPAVTVKSSHSSARSVHSASRDLVGGGEEQSSTPPSVGVQLPRAEQAARSERDQQPARAVQRASAPARAAAAPASSQRAPAPARAAPTTAASVRCRGRGSATSSSATARPGRGDITTTRSPSTTASSTSCVTSTTVRGSSRERAREPLLHLLARERVERGERLVEREHRLAGEQRAHERDALAHPARQLRRPRVARSRRGRSARTAACACSRACAAPHAPHAQRERGVVERARPRQQQVALRHQHRRVGRRPCPRPAPAGRRSAPAASTCRSRSRRRPRRSRPARRAGPSRAARRPRRRTTAAEDPLHSVDPYAVHRSLRGHYPTGSKGQRQVARREGALSQPAHPPAPLVVTAAPRMLARAAGRPMIRPSAP